ncbi:MAG: molybdopterin converting factor [Bradyrhizobium sp.]|nr:molybdopterin converting factor [Bradyrhizobium sp.]
MANVLLFGRFADLAGWRQRELAVVSLAELRDFLASGYPELATALAGRGASVAVNQTVTRGDRPLCPGDEVALFPPVSGG